MRKKQPATWTFFKYILSYTSTKWGIPNLPNDPGSSANFEALILTYVPWSINLVIDYCPMVLDLELIYVSLILWVEVLEEKL